MQPALFSKKVRGNMSLLDNTSSVELTSYFKLRARQDSCTFRSLATASESKPQGVRYNPCLLRTLALRKTPVRVRFGSPFS